MRSKQCVRTRRIDRYVVELLFYEPLLHHTEISNSKYYFGRKVNLLVLGTNIEARSRRSICCSKGPETRYGLGQIVGSFRNRNTGGMSWSAQTNTYSANLIERSATPAPKVVVSAVRENFPALPVI